MMEMRDFRHPVIDEDTVKLIAARVTASLREDLQAALADLTRPHPEAGMTVDQVAVRLHVTRSTVYAHWRDWGGYKLGAGKRAPIRFDASSLPNQAAESGNRSRGSAPQTAKRVRQPRRRGLIIDAPRLVHSLDETA